MGSICSRDDAIKEKYITDIHDHTPQQANHIYLSYQPTQPRMIIRFPTKISPPYYYKSQYDS